MYIYIYSNIGILDVNTTFTVPVLSQHQVYVIPLEQHPKIYPAEVLQDGFEYITRDAPRHRACGFGDEC